MVDTSTAGSVSSGSGTPASGTPSGLGLLSGSGTPPPVPPVADVPKVVIQRRTISPYDLTSSDNPGSLISQPLLRGSNYDEWATNIRLALSARKKFGFVDGSIPKPTEDSGDLEDWWTNNALVVSWLKLTIDPVLRSTISHHDVAHDLWEHIKQRFSLKNGQKIQRLKAELAVCRQRGLALEAYYGKLMKIWTTLDDYRHTTNCGCPQGHDLEKERADEKLHQFLLGIDELVFGAAKSSLLSREPLPTLEEAYNVLAQDEESRSIAAMSDNRNDGVSFAVQSNPKAYGGQNDKNALCTSCGKNGHLAENCFRSIGYPPWWGDRPRNKEPPPTRDQSRNKGVSVAQANSVMASSGAPTHVANSMVTHADRVGFSGLKEDEWHTLMQMLNERKTEKGTLSLLGMLTTNSWIIDTGASNHMTGSVDFLFDVRDMAPMSIKLPDGRFTISNRIGSVRMGSRLNLQNVFLVADLHCHLISVSQLTREVSCVFQLTEKLCLIQDRITRTLIGAGEQAFGLYFFRGMEALAAVSHTDTSSREVWHCRMGHPSLKAVESLSSSGVIRSSFKNSGVSTVSANKTCEVCMRAKQTRDVFPISSNKTTACFELVHCDLWGPYRSPALCGSRYFLTIVDDFSRATWIYLIESKQEAPTSLKKFVALVERQFETKIKTIRSDNGSEFICLRDFFSTNGIIHETSCVGTPQQNGRVERKHRHILNVACALRFQANLPIPFWGQCALAAGYLINWTPSSVLLGKTPFEILYKRPPPLDHLRILGCLCFVHDQKTNGNKFASRSKKSIFIGYPFGRKGWRVYDLESGKVSVSRDVVFCEDIFPFASTSSESSSTESALANDVIDIFNIDDNLSFGSTNISTAADTAGLDNTTSGPSPITEPISDSAVVIDNTLSSIPTAISISPAPAPSPEIPAASPVPESLSILSESLPDTPSPMVSAEASESISVTSAADINATEPELLGRGHRKRLPSTRLADFVTNTVHSTPFPIEHFVSCTGFSETHKAYLFAITSAKEPKSYAQAIKDENWRFAVTDEIDALDINDTFTIEELPEGKQALGSMWVFRIKHQSDGTVERYKARLVVLGNHQVEGLDYKETFAPVAKMTTVRCFLEVSAAYDWEVHQMDVHNAFLHGDLNEEVYMRPPPGFHMPVKNKVLRLRKSMYGLKQAPRCWFAKLQKSLLEYGFKQSRSDYSLFTLNDGKRRLHVLVYVDDLIISGNTLDHITGFKEYLSTCFHMKDLGILKYFLGIEVSRSSKGIYLSQRKYILDLVSEAGLLGAKPCSFPMDQNHGLALAVGEEIDDPTRYRRLVGRLIYLHVTRPELAYSVHILSQFMQSPKQAHWDAALRVVRYLKGCPGQGILLKSGMSLTLTAWCDADYSGCPITRRSLTGWFVQLGDSPLSWKTIKQDVVSRSSAESEYRAMSDTVQEIIWLKALLLSFGVSHDQPVQLHCDNMAAIHLSANPVFHERTKHVEVDCHFVRDKVIDGTIVTNHVSTKLQLADIMTKALGRKEFDSFLVKLGVMDLHAPT
ncbi:unnamed protein product [Microthlaspi erraticum]|uniref:Integrase catalytic domain-containing protein n=1 Tax=Microthlaspi erraticum TaxID=1685480 RepID=A0A6D2JM81_9BRAS|nr:unnamed protein product [Microthlaspi erraticum]